MAYIGRDIQYGTLDKQSFTANSSATVFTLDTTVKDAKSLLVSVGGVIQEPDVAYTASGTTLTFSEAPVTGNIVYVIYLGKELIVGASRESITYQSGTGNGSTTPVTLSAAANNAQSIMVMLNGVTQTPETDYTVNGTTLTFNEAVPNGVAILVYHLANQAQAFTVNDASVTNAHIVSLDASKLTGSLPGSMGVNTTTLDQSIASLGLHVGVSENKIAYNLPEAYIDVFQGDDGILTETDVDRDASGEYFATAVESYGAATYWPYTDATTQTLTSAGGGAAWGNSDWWEEAKQGDDPGGYHLIGYWSNTFGFATTYFYIDYKAEYRWTGLKYAFQASHSQIKDWRLEYSNDGTNWTIMDQTGTTTSAWTGQSFTSGHDNMASISDAANGVFTNSNPGAYSNHGGGILTFGTPVTARYLKLAANNINTNLNDPTAAVYAFIPQYQALESSTNATGTLISKASTAASTVSTASGVMLYEDASGTGTLGTDLKVHFSSDDGANWTEASSYGNSMGFSGNIKMVPLGSTSLSGGTGTTVKMKAEWANQEAATPATGGYHTGNQLGNITLTSTVQESGNGVANNLLNGVNASNNSDTTNGFHPYDSTDISGDILKFDFGSGKTIIEAKFIQYGAESHGTWKWQGSNDDSSWTDIGSSFTMGGGVTEQLHTQLNNNTTSYRYYQLLGITGNTTYPCIWSEIQFKHMTVAATGGKVQRLHGWAVNY